MKFQRKRDIDTPEINLIPLIDVLLVIIIFLMLTTTYQRFASLEINLPTADVEKQATPPQEIHIAISASGQIVIDKHSLTSNDVRVISEALQRAAGSAKEPIIVINADAKATHQSVIDVMQAAQMAGLPRISFATQSAP